MKKIFALLMVCSLCGAASYLDGEQKYFFTSEILIDALQNNVDEEQKRVDAATVYSELMNQTTGMVSIDNLFAVCRAAGFNTYRQDGFESCKRFINSLVELDENTLSGFCPGLDENGKNPNALKSITDQTRIGDRCSSTNIYAGEVVFKKQYNCTCMASACNDGYEFKGGACVTIVADGEGFCLRSENKIQKDMTLEESVNFCQKLAKKNKCKYKTVVIQHKNLNVICNATKDEVNKVLQTNEENKLLQKEKQINGLKYYEVCGKDSGKTGKTEYCVKDIFKWTNTQIGQALELAKDYAKIKHKRTIYCKKQHRKNLNDDYIACSTLDGNFLYEFKFDDVLESIDADRRRSERQAICALYGGTVLGDTNECKNVGQTICTTMKNSITKYGHAVDWKNSKCLFTDYGFKHMNEEDFEKSLAKIEGLDNNAFFDLQLVGTRKNFNLDDEIKKYVKDQLGGNPKVSCDAGYQTIRKSKVIGKSDDVKRCYVDGKPIDFVIDDMSELFGYVRDSSESGAKCISNQGKFDGHYCRGLTEKECDDLEIKMLAELKTHGWAGDDDLVDWDENAQACELNAAQFANNVNKVGKYAAITGMTIGGVFTGGTTTVAAISMMAVELAGIAGEIYVERKKELLPQEWADDFLKASRVCKQPNCAEKTLRENMGKISQSTDMLNRDVLDQVDSELARLADLLPEERLVEIMSDPEYPNCWETWECQEKIFIVMQMTSLAAGITKGFVKLTQVLSKKMAQVASKNTTSLVKVAKTEGTTNNALVKVGETERSTNNAIVKSEGSANSASKAGETASAESKAGKSANAENKVGESVNTAGNVSETRIYTFKDFENNPSAIDEIFTKGGDFIQIDRTSLDAKIIRKLINKGREYGFEFSNGKGGEIISFTKATDKASDVANATSKASEAVNVAGKVSETANTAVKLDEASAVFEKLGKNIDDIVKESEQAKGTHLIVAKLSNDEIKVLKDSLRKRGLDVSDMPANSSNYGLPELWITKSVKVDEASNVGKVASKTGESANATGKTADKTRETANTAGKAEKSVYTSGESANAAARAKKIAEAQERGDLGFHGTDADISLADRIRPSKNTSAALGNGGYGIAKEYEAAEAYAVRRLIENQYEGFVDFYRENGVLIVKPENGPLKLNNKICYVYTTAKKSSVTWDPLVNSSAGKFNAARMPEAVEIYGKKPINLDDLIRDGKVKIVY